SLESEHFPLSQLIANVNAIALDQARQKSLALDYAVDPAIPAVLRGDLLRLSQILINLIGNAIKFTPSGRVDVYFRLLKREGDQLRLGIEVRDTGIGMSVEQQAKLFEAFSQADSSITRKYGGSGLGLSICQRLVRLMGGEILVRSTPAQGSSFSFEIDLGAAPGQGDSTTEQAADGGVLAGKRVLLVEDIPTNQLVAGEMLTELGLNVVTVDNGREALEEMSRNGLRYDLILMDVQMPEMDGLEATRRLRSGLVLPELPIIAMTAHALDEEKGRCLAAGMNDFISKPIDPDTLRRVLLRQFPQRESATTLATVAEAPAELPDLPGIDTREGMRRVMNKAALYERILRDFLGRFGEESLAIRQAVSSGDLATAERRTHNIKGLAGTIGASALQAGAQQLEASLREHAGERLESEIATFESLLAEVIDGLARHFADGQPG
ncbi:MAG: ATP-binding protein, partial [Azonexus sp.]|nr:ATP-binding protein [Azonexus sp.]